MSSSPNLSLLSSTHTESLTLSDIANMSALGSNRSNSEASQDSPARGSGSLKVNGEGPWNFLNSKLFHNVIIFTCFLLLLCLLN